jgi:hypothetical protein
VTVDGTSLGYTTSYTFSSVSANHTISAAFAVNTCTGFRTYTQGGWGTTPSGSNPGTYLNSHFNSAFPSGVTIGCTNTMTLTTANAVRNFLPSGGTPGALPSGSTVDPGGSISNTLAGQAVALTINIKMDQIDDTFSAATAPLSTLTINSGILSGWSVQAALDEANKVLGGCASSYSAGDLTTVLNNINYNYDNGTSDNGYLTCVVGSARHSAQPPAYSAVEPASVVVYPNPSDGNFKVAIPSKYSEAKIFITDIAGRAVQNIDVTGNTGVPVEFNMTNVPRGVYLVNISVDNLVYKTKLILN